jgi:hypothetical protein
MTNRPSFERTGVNLPGVLRLPTEARKEAVEISDREESVSTHSRITQPSVREICPLRLEEDGM